MAWKQLNIVIVILSISANVVRSQLQDERKNDSQVCYIQSGHTFHCEGQNLRRVPLISSNATTLHLESNVVSHITTKSFRRYSPLANLHLDHNGITLLVPSWAINLPELRGMTLSNNRLTALHRNTFDGLLSLRNLNLKNNEIVRVWEGWCIGLTRVVNLDLSYNRLAAIEPSKWCSFPRLKILDLSHNEITVLESRWSGGMRSLSILHLQNNLVREVHNQTFTSLYSLERLFLQNNLIENFGEGWSTDLNATHSIDLSHNRIETIKGDLFPGMTRVTWIDLQESNIRILQNNSFRMMKRVEELILERNNIQEISTDTFKDLSSVLWLRLQNNDIRVLQPGSFAGMKSLLRLSLQNNQIPVLQKGTFGGLSSLTHLYLSHNSISRFGNCWGGNFEKLQYLDLSWNNITILGEQNFMCDTGSYCANSSGFGQHIDGTSPGNWIGLQTLILTGNPIGHGLAKGAFQGLPKLLHLLLDNCDVEVIASEQFIGLHSLRLLDVSFNKIVSLDSYQFQYLPSLMVVNAKHNFIASLGPDSLFGGSLMYLDLRSNNIETIPSSALRLDLADGIELHIANNPLFCDNRLKWIQQALSQGYIHHVDLPNLSTQNFYFRPAIADVSDAGCANLGMRLIDVRSGLLPPYVTTLPSSEASSTQHSTGLPSTPSSKSNTGEYMAITNSVVSDVTYVTTSKTPQNADDDTRRSDSWLSKDQTIGYFMIISICLIIFILLTGKVMKCFACWRRCKESNSEGKKFERYHKIKKLNLHSMLSTSIPFKNTTRNNSSGGKVEQTPVLVSPPLPLSVGLVSEIERGQPPPPPPRRKVHTERDEPPPIPTRTTNQDKSPRTTATCKPKVRHTYFRGENLEDSQAAPVLAEDAMEYFPNQSESFEDIYTNQPTNNGDYQCRETDLGSESSGCNYNVLVTKAMVHGHWRHSDMDDSSLDTSSSGISGTSDRLQRRQFEDLRFLVDINSTDEETLGSSFNEGDMERTLDGEEPGQSDPDDCKSANTKTDHHA